MTHKNETLHKDWAAQYELIERIRSCGGIGNYARQISLDPAFNPSDRIARCMDERTCGGVRSAGPFFLMSESDISQYVRSARIQGITSHKGCGAARIAYLREMGLPDDTNVDQETIDAHANTRAMELARKLDLPYNGQLGVEPATHHIAVAAYYTMADFDPSKSGELPAGFVINRNHTPKDAALNELEIAISIALGSHGFEDRFTKKSPFYIFAIGNDGEQSVEGLKNEVLHVVDKYDGRVALDGFAAPCE